MINLLTIVFSLFKFEDITKPDMREIYENEKNLWFPRTDTETNLKYDTRTPRLFKVENIR